MTTAEKTKAAVAVVRAVAETVKEVGEAPAGVVYSALMQHGCTLVQFERIVSILLEGKLIRRSNDLLIWIGPK